MVLDGARCVWYGRAHTVTLLTECTPAWPRFGTAVKLLFQTQLSKRHGAWVCRAV